MIDKIKFNIIHILNSSMKNKVNIKYSRILYKTYQLLDMAFEEYCFNNELNNIQQKKVSRAIEYIGNKYNLFEINMKIIEDKNVLISDIKISNALNGQTTKEIDNDNTQFEEYIEILFYIVKDALKKMYLNMDTEEMGVEFNVNSHESEKCKIIFKPLSEISLGQRAVAILTIITEGMTSLDISSPLIIDQPEDQLDNRFIYEHLIKTIRQLKEKRQIILVTHNANIPVSGDAENIMCLASNNENGWLDTYGSLDNNSIQNKIIDILEGGKESFKLRLSKYST